MSGDTPHWEALKEHLFAGSVDVDDEELAHEARLGSETDMDDLGVQDFSGGEETSAKGVPRLPDAPAVVEGFKVGLACTARWRPWNANG